ncbi:MAG: AAA family ATPase [Sumerlaeia bacterium]
MYLDFFGFEREPFNITPDSTFLFSSQRHRDALASLEYGINHRKGFIALTGEIGSGKTTLCRALLKRLNRDKTRIALILNPELNALELLQAINAEYGLEHSSTSKRELLQTLNSFVLQQYEQDNNCVLVLDESQRLTPDALEQVRLLSNLETETTKLIQIALVGQPELDDLLHLPELEQLNQRITVRFHIGPLSEEEMAEYIDHRIAVAKPDHRVHFEKKALKLLYRHSGGIPRKINVVCDRVLLMAFVEESFKITESIARKAIDEVAGTRQRTLQSRQTGSNSGLRKSAAEKEFPVGSGAKPDLPPEKKTESPLSALLFPFTLIFLVLLLIIIQLVSIFNEPDSGEPQVIAQNTGEAVELTPIPESEITPKPTTAQPPVQTVVSPVADPAEDSSSDALSQKNEPIITPSQAPELNSTADAAVLNADEPINESVLITPTTEPTSAQTATPAPTQESTVDLPPTPQPSPTEPIAAEPIPAPTPTPTADPTPLQTPNTTDAAANTAMIEPPTTLVQAPTPEPTAVPTPLPTPTPEQEHIPATTSTPTPTTIPELTQTPTPAPQPIIDAPDWTYDANGFARVKTPAVHYVASVLTWLNVRLSQKLPEAELQRLRESTPQVIATLSLTNGNPPYFLQVAELPPLVQALPKDYPVLMQIDVRSNLLSPWCVLLSANDESLTLADPARGRVVIPLSYLEDVLVQVQAPYADEKRITGLQLGDKGERVVRLQRLLGTILKVGLPQTGNFDLQTSEALKEFQTRMKIPAGGVVDSVTAYKLYGEAP